MNQRQDWEPLKRFVVSAMQIHGKMDIDDLIKEIDTAIKTSQSDPIDWTESLALIHELDADGSLIIDSSDPEWPIVRKVERQPKLQVETLF